MNIIEKNWKNYIKYDIEIKQEETLEKASKIITDAILKKKIKNKI